MKSFLLILSIFFISPICWSQNSYKTASELVLSQPNQLLLIKFKDNIENPITSSRFSLNTFTEFKVSPVFLRGKETYVKERKIFLKKYNKPLPHFENYFYLNFNNELLVSEAQEILRRLYLNPSIDYAYFEPPTEDAVEPFRFSSLVIPSYNTKEVVPNFEDQQFHLKPSPEGVDAFFAWSIPGGTGLNVKIADIETGFNKEHVELSSPFFEGENQNSSHGTAVLGEILAKRDGRGVTGIAYEARFGFAGTNFNGSWDAWRVTLIQALDLAISNLQSQDVLIIEQHCQGPDNNKYTAVEYYPAVFDIIKSATDQGIHVVAAAGNGDSDFDSEIYEGAFDTNQKDSGAILVGAAGSPISGQHFERMYFSNYGSRVDTFAYGQDVVTTGYGDLYSDGDRNEYYTKSFSGTSSATPIVTGVVASILGIAKANHKVLTPIELRQAIRDTGVQQRGSQNEHIGKFTDIKSIYEYFNRFE